ncbi:MAG TPA: hypothetical protein VN873_11815 [Candidatus Angelobacter sp.]|nr:hypothetical protein [Candidatus Angelobacter sp.]
MRRPILIFAFCFAICAGASAATGRVIKVLPQFLDLQGRHAVSPSLYDRDAYQFFLRTHPEKVSGMRFAVQWKASGAGAEPLKLRVEAIGISHGEPPPKVVLEKEVKTGGWFSHWAYVPLSGADYTKMGEVTAWRVTLWEGDKMIGEQKSFLW